MPRVGETPLLPFWATADGLAVRLYAGHAPAVLSALKPKSVHCIITSPPYWGLRDYGSVALFDLEDDAREWARATAGQWNAVASCGGTARYTAAEPTYERKRGKWAGRVRAETRWADGSWSSYGSEPTLEQYVAHSVEVFAAAHGVLRDDGTLWLNLGDSYAEGSKAPGRVKPGNLLGVPWRVALALQDWGWVLRQDVIWRKPSPMPESARNRCTKAHEYVFTFSKSERYYFDAEAIKDRSKHAGKPDRYRNSGRYVNQADVAANAGHDGGAGAKGTIPAAANKRSVWSVEDEKALLDWMALNEPEALARYLAEGGYCDSVWRVSSQGYEGAHFATFPPRLIEPMVKAGTGERGCCADCGKPWKRITQERTLTRERPNDYVKRAGEGGTGNSCPNSAAGLEVRTVGWRPDCECRGELVKEEVWVPNRTGTVDYSHDGRETPAIPKGWAVGQSESHEAQSAATPLGRMSADDRRAAAQGSDGKYETVVSYVSTVPLEDHPVTPCTVLDPFVGSGTTAAVCIDLGRNAIGIDLSREYLDKNARVRVVGELLARPSLAALVPARVRATSTGPIGLPVKVSRG